MSTLTEPTGDVYPYGALGLVGIYVSCVSMALNYPCLTLRDFCFAVKENLPGKYRGYIRPRRSESFEVNYD